MIKRLLICGGFGLISAICSWALLNWISTLPVTSEVSLALAAQRHNTVANAVNIFCVAFFLGIIAFNVGDITCELIAQRVECPRYSLRGLLLIVSVCAVVLFFLRILF
jgi:putative Mn2+ efflux pump MntP